MCVCQGTVGIFFWGLSFCLSQYVLVLKTGLDSEFGHVIMTFIEVTKFIKLCLMVQIELYSFGLLTEQEKSYSIAFLTLSSYSCLLLQPYH